MTTGRRRSALAIGLSASNVFVWFIGANAVEVKITTVLAISCAVAILTGALGGALRAAGATFAFWGVAYLATLWFGRPTCPLFDSSCGDPARASSAIWVAWTGLAIGLVAVVAGMTSTAIRHVAKEPSTNA